MVSGQTQVQVVSATFDVEGNAAAISSDIFVETTGYPRVKLAIGEDNVGRGKEVLVNVVPAEVGQSPVVVWRQSVRVLAELGVSVVIK